MSRTVISSTDIIKQIRELQDDVSTIVETYNDDAREAAFQEDADHEQYEDIEVDTSEVGELKDFMELLVDTDDKAKIEELISLLEAAEEAEGYNSDWRHGADLIPSYDQSFNLTLLRIPIVRNLKLKFDRAYLQIAMCLSHAECLYAIAWCIKLACL